MNRNVCHIARNIESLCMRKNCAIHSPIHENRNVPFFELPSFFFLFFFCTPACQFTRNSRGSYKLPRFACAQCLYKICNFSGILRQFNFIVTLNSGPGVSIKILEIIYKARALLPLHPDGAMTLLCANDGRVFTFLQRHGFARSGVCKLFTANASLVIFATRQPRNIF